MKYHFKGIFEKEKISRFLRELSDTGLKNWSYPVKTLDIHLGKYYLITNSHGTDVSSERQVIHILAFTVGIQLTFCCGTCDVSTLVWMTRHKIYII